MDLRRVSVIAVSLALFVAHGCATSREPSIDAAVDAPAANRAPIARVDDQHASVGALVTLSGARSTDADGDSLGFTWSFRLRPEGSTASLDRTATSETSFVADVGGVYAIDLVVDDGSASSPPATALVVVSEAGALPIARAGDDVSAVVGRRVTLDGSASSDSAGRTLGFAWEILMSPAGSAASLDASDSVATHFTPDLVGEYVVSLVVSAEADRSAPDVVRVTVTEAPPTGGDVSRGVFDPDEVYLAGTLSEGACYLDAMAHWSAPDVAAVGFDCYFDNRGAQIAPSGTMLYTNTFEDVLREFHCDDCPGFAAGDRYPDAPLDNDTILATPPCTDDGTMRLTGFLVSPDGERIHGCNGAWYDASGVEVARDVDVRHYGRDGHVLLDDAVLDLASGASRPISGLDPACTVLTQRAGVSTGFIVAIHCTDHEELWSIAHDGLATMEGTYPAAPSGYTAQYGAALEAGGALMQFARGPITFEDAIIRRAIDGTSELVYTEETTPSPLVMIHISDLVTGP